MKSTYRARIAAQTKTVRRLCGGTPRDRITALSERTARAFADDPAAITALQVAGAGGLATLMLMRRSAANPAFRAWLAERGAA